MQRFVPFLLALATTAALFGRATGFPYVLDDRSAVLENPMVTMHDVRRILTSGAEPQHWGSLEGDHYRPVGVLSLAADHAWSGPTPWGFRATNLVLHSLVTALVFMFARRLSPDPWVAGCAFGLFLVHPVHTEAIVQLKGRFELLSATFGLAALAVHVSSRVPGPVSALASATLFGLALLSKEESFGLLAVLPVYDAVVFGVWGDLAATLRWWRARAVRYLPWVLVAGAALAIRYAVLGYVTPNAVHRLDNPLAYVSAPVRVWSALGLLPRYAQLLVLPIHLSPDYSRAEVMPTVFPHGFSSWIGLALGAAAATALIASFRKRSPAGFGWALAGATYAPVANVLVPIGTTMGERLMYFPSVGLALVAALATRPGVGTSSRKRSRLTTLLLIVVCTLAALRSYRRVDDWRDEDALWRAALEASPRSAKVLAYAAREPLRRGDPERARDLMSRSVAIEGDWDLSREMLASALLQLHRADEALPHVEALERLRGPDEPTTRHLFGLAYLQLGRPADAAREFGRADDLFSTPPAAFNRAFALYQAGDEAAAAKAYAYATTRFPGDPRATRERPRIVAVLTAVVAAPDPAGCEVRAWARSWLEALADPAAIGPPTPVPECVSLEPSAVSERRTTPDRASGHIE